MSTSQQTNSNDFEAVYTLFPDFPKNKALKTFSVRNHMSRIPAATTMETSFFAFFSLDLSLSFGLAVSTHPGDPWTTSESNERLVRTKFASF